MPGLVPFTYDITGFILLKATSIVVIILKCFNKSVVGKKKNVPLHIHLWWCSCFYRGYNCVLHSIVKLGFS